MHIHTPEGISGGLAYFDTGNRGARATRVYIGGLGSASSVTFAEVAAHPLIDGDARSIMIDLLGSGWSDHPEDFSYTVESHADSIASTLDAAGVSSAHVIGHSLGGSISIILASTRPDLVAHLTLCEPNLEPGLGIISGKILSWNESEFVTGGYQSLLESMRRDEQRKIPFAGSAQTTARWSALALHRTATSLVAERYPALRAQLDALVISPVYVIGADSNNTPDDGLLATCQVATVPEAGHFMMNDNLEAFCALIAPGLLTAIR
ncbi:alpha/beta hydrolase [Rhodococcus sp. IEGM 1241]|uniref:alpha/beta fold hydrolase n=1 Tax=Rhodococcus sp. IEGM 1241 TaxID=3082228 RepID=UPI002953CE8B|nr:alpha/beta hydrolase [Rhodococcus sp. IEGM 1241]MDV8015701.1 alpha/beta hydrolase [Rhodococcus sp. IEGM 1241]